MSDPPAPLQLDLFSPRPSAAGEVAAAPAPAADEVAAAPQAEAGPVDRSRPLFRRLDRLLDGRLGSLVLTRNRRRILSVRPSRRPGELAVRLDACFADASEEQLEAVATWVKGGRGRRRALARLRDWFTAAAHHRQPASAAGAPPRRRPVLRPVGRTADLRKVLAHLEASELDAPLGVGITWGRAPSHRRSGRRGPLARRGHSASIRLGSYCFETRVIRIHRALDHPDVPRYVLEAVVFHEMLHATLPPPEVRAGRRRLHPPEFRRRERAFRHHQAARRWIDANLERLLARR